MLKIILFFLVIYIIGNVISKTKFPKRKSWMKILWLVPYFIGLFVISKYGPEMLGGNGMFEFWPTILWTLLLSIIILLYSIKSSQDIDEIKFAAKEIDELQV